MLRLSRVAIIVVGATAFMAAGCETVKPYEKEHLLDPLMDDAALEVVKPGLMASACGDFEKLATASGGSSEGTSCPTCGG